MTLTWTRRRWLAGTLALSCRAAGVFRYRNPIVDGIDPGGVRDCQIFRDGGRWYMTGTSAEFWKGPNPGVRLYSSADLLHWNVEGLLIDRSRLSPDVWYYDRFWAPEVHPFDGRYYLTFNCRNEARQLPHGCGLAVAERLRGPYRVLTAEAPLTPGNDLTLFRDRDGKTWAFFNRGREFGIGCGEVDLKTGRFVSEPRSMMLPGGAGAWDSIGVEGAYAIRHKGTYYLFYSSWTRGYEIGVASARAVTGPWTKQPKNPFYGAQSEAACRKNGVPYTGDPNNPFRAVGHNAIFAGPGGRWWLSCHGIVEGRNPMLVIDPVRFEGGGSVRADGPTFTPQEVK